MPFSSIDRPKRGFSGRPLIALVFAIGMGILASYVQRRWKLDSTAVFIVLAVIIWAVYYLWYRLEKPDIRK